MNLLLLEKSFTCSPSSFIIRKLKVPSLINEKYLHVCPAEMRNSPLDISMSFPFFRKSLISSSLNELNDFRKDIMFCGSFNFRFFCIANFRFKCHVSMTDNEQGLAKLGDLKNVKPGTAAE